MRHHRLAAAVPLDAVEHRQHELRPARSRASSKSPVSADDATSGWYTVALQQPFQPLPGCLP